MEITAVEAAFALKILQQFGKSSFNPDYEPDTTELLAAGFARAVRSTDHDSLTIAATLVEDVNYHDLAAVIRATE